MFCRILFWLHNACMIFFIPEQAMRECFFLCMGGCTKSPNPSPLHHKSNGLSLRLKRAHSLQLKVARCCRWHLGSFFKVCFCLVCYITNHLMTGPLGNFDFFFLPDLNVSLHFVSETLRFLGNKTHCSPPGPVIKINCCLPGRHLDFCHVITYRSNNKNVR